MVRGLCPAGCGPGDVPEQSHNWHPLPAGLPTAVTAVDSVTGATYYVGFFTEVGKVFSHNNVVAGIIFLIAILANSRISCLFAALGRAGQTMTGCLRHGVTTLLVGELVLYEILSGDVLRIKDKQRAFELLEHGGSQ